MCKIWYNVIFRFITLVLSGRATEGKPLSKVLHAWLSCGKSKHSVRFKCWTVTTAWSSFCHWMESVYSARSFCVFCLNILLVSGSNHGCNLHTTTLCIKQIPNCKNWQMCFAASFCRIRGNLSTKLFCTKQSVNLFIFVWMHMFHISHSDSNVLRLSPTRTSSWVKKTVVNVDVSINLLAQESNRKTDIALHRFTARQCWVQRCVIFLHFLPLNCNISLIFNAPHLFVSSCISGLYQTGVC